MIYVILGMHKSGTTLISETLHKSGINMIESTDEDVDYNNGHKFERFATNTLNKRILPSSPAMLDVSLAEKNIQITDEIKDRMRDVVENCESLYPDWGFKDPRTCLTYHLWKEILPEHKLIIIYRNPSQIVSHVMASARRPDKKLIRSIRALKSWKVYNQLLLNIIKKNPSSQQYLLLNYHEFMHNPESRKSLSSFIKREVFDARKFDNYNFREEINTVLKLDQLFSRVKAKSIYQELEYCRQRQSQSLEIPIEQ